MNPAELAAYEAFVRSRGRPLLQTALLLTDDPGHAEDLVQLTFERLARHWSRLGPDPAAYARRTLVNLANDRWRRTVRRVAEVPVTHDLGPGHDPHPGVEQRLDLVEALRHLTRRQRAVLVLRYFDDLTETQTAAALGCSVGTVKSTTAKALAALRRHAPDQPRERTSL